MIGFNRDVAWSFTNTGADVIDYYEEEVDDAERPTRYRVGGAWRRLESRIERYRGRDGELLGTDTLYVTHRGPVIERDGRYLSMAWTVLRNGGENGALREIMEAGSVEDWMTSMRSFAAPAQNGIVADRSGTIAIRSNGRFPIHPDGDGRDVEEGTDTGTEWAGFWDVEEYPGAVDPEQGYLASANQEPLDPDVEGRYLGASWPSPWRAMRINQLLRADSAVTPDAMRRYQLDPGNAKAELFVPAFLEAAARAEAAGRADDGILQAAELLADWDRRYTRENQRAVLFEYAMAELAERTWDELDAPPDGDAEPRRVARPATAILAQLLSQPDSPWWDERHTDDIVEVRDTILLRSLAAGYERAVERHGPPEDGGWRWGRAWSMNIWHLLRLPSLSALGIPMDGGPGTLNPLYSRRGRSGVSWRMVVELGPEVRAWTIYPGGQSGNPASPRYADRIAAWSAGELEAARLPRRPDELEGDRVAAILELTPAP